MRWRIERDYQDLGAPHTGRIEIGIDGGISLAEAHVVILMTADHWQVIRVRDGVR
jgi:hypothetical protein